MKVKKYQIKLTLTNEMLGTVGKDQEIYTTYIAAKNSDLSASDLSEEVSTLPVDERTGWTGFHTLDGGPIIYDYVVKGFFKDACGMLRRDSSTMSAKEKAYKKIIDGLVFILPRQIRINTNGQALGKLERPLRAETAQGPRVALARSDTAPVGSTLEFFVSVIGDVSEKLLREWLDYGQLRGLGQWRNGGYGTFTYSMDEVLD